MENVILLHGALGCSSDLKLLADSFQKQGFNPHIFSFSGHGKTTFGNNFGIEQFAQELNQFITIKQLKNPTIFGYSMGGYVALYLASQQPLLLGKIITLGTKFNWSKEAVNKETRMLDPEILTEKVPAFAKLLEEKHGSGWKELIKKTAEMMREISNRYFLSDNLLKSITCPTLLGLADKDQMVSVEETLHVFKILPKVSMYMLPDTKHQIETANSDVLVNLIAEFIIKQAT